MTLAPTCTELFLLSLPVHLEDCSGHRGTHKNSVYFFSIDPVLQILKMDLWRLSLCIYILSFALFSSHHSNKIYIQSCTRGECIPRFPLMGVSLSQMCVLRDFEAKQLLSPKPLISLITFVFFNYWIISGQCDH